MRLRLHLVFVLTCSPCAGALAQSLDLAQYAHTAWRIRDGFTKGIITTIAQTADGYLWLGTQFGLVRFDGVRAVPWQPPAGQRLPSDRVTRLIAARDSTLWIATRKGVVSWRDGTLTSYGGDTSQYNRPLVEDAEGTVWFGTSTPGQLCAVRRRQLQCSGSEALGDRVMDIFEDKERNLWVAAATGLWRWAPGAPQHYPGIRVTAFLRAWDDDGGPILATDSTLNRLVDGRVQPYRLPGQRTQFTAATLFRSSDGNLWVGSPVDGLVHVRDGRITRFTVADGLSSKEVLSFLEDREGNVWVSTFEGLDRFRPVSAQTLSSKQGLASTSVWSVQATADGSVWMNAITALNRWRNDTVTVYRDVKDRIATLGVDGQGRLLVATDDAVLRYTNGGFAPVIDRSLGRITALAADADGTLWIASETPELLRRSPAGTLESIEPSWIRNHAVVRSMLADRVHGAVWLGLAEGGIAYVARDTVRATYSAATGLGSGRVSDLSLGSDSAVWAATEGGLSRVKDGHVRTLTSRNGLPCDAAHWSIEDDDGARWVYLSCGLVRLAPSELQAWWSDSTRSVQGTTLDSDDGVRTQAMLSAPPQATKAADGRIWFESFSDGGVSVVDPRHLRFNTVPPPVHVEQITADGKTYEPRSAATGRVRLPPRVRDLEIQYTALSLAVPEKVRFRFKLEGQDPDWREVVNQRRIEYSNLPPGAYRFRLTAANNDGVWNATGASLDFTIEPAWNQTWWFFAILAALIVGTPVAAAVAWQRRRARLAAERAESRFDAMLAERTRVARELHDTLLGDMAGVAMQLNAGARRVETLGGGNSGVVELLSTLSTQVQRTLVEARRSVTAMRVPDELPPLHEQLASAAQRTFAETGISARVEHTGLPRRYPPTVEAEILSIATEAMTNARNHAGCRTVTVTCSYVPRALQVRVRDDGRGFDASQGSPAGHWGLIGMRERAASIGATLAVSSSPSAGTEVVLAVPGGPGRWTWWNRSVR